MSYESIDKLQNILAKEVFGYTKDPKKAAGRALGTFVEIISFYLLESWGFSKHISIENRLIEYGNKSISHNVEYTLHPIKNKYLIDIKTLNLPLTSSKIFKLANLKNKQIKLKNNALLTTNKILRNSCIVAITADSSIVATIENKDSKGKNVLLAEQYFRPFAMVECKRVGVEEGMKKGPQTIEKAKQGAYVAKSVSALQKIRDEQGTLFGVIQKGKKFYIKPYVTLIDEIINSKDPEFYNDFILTIGVVSNHGNWFTSDNPNKELLVLAQSYDWLVFLTDKGICEFIDHLLLNPLKKYEPVKKTFLSSYQNRKTKNQFTKVQMNYESHLLLLDYFTAHKKQISSWFNVITPQKLSLEDLQNQLRALAEKRFKK